jgi:hypothetical protein
MNVSAILWVYDDDSIGTVIASKVAGSNPTAGMHPNQ